MQNGFICHRAAKKRDDAKQPHLLRRQLLFVKDEQTAQLVIERRSRRQLARAESIIEEAAWLIAVRQRIGKDAQAERMPIKPFTDLFALRRRAAHIQISEQARALLRG